MRRLFHRAGPGPSPARAGVSARRADVFAVLIVGGLTLGMLVLLGRVAQLQAHPSAELVAHKDDRISRAPEPALRGDILDRRGRVLAASRFGYRVFVDPSRFPSPPDVAMAALAQATGVPLETLASRLIPKIADNERRKAHNDEVDRRRKLLGSGAAPSAQAGAQAVDTPAEADPEPDADSEEEAAAEPDPDRKLALHRYISLGGVLDDWRIDAVKELKVPGVHLELRGVRGYPSEDLTASLVGLVDVDHKGILGVERSVNKDVVGTAGQLEFVRDAYMRPLWVNQGGYTAPQRGQDVRLSIDLEIQRIVVEELEQGIAEAQSAGGRAVVLDPVSGEILAMVDMVRQPKDAVPYDWDHPWNGTGTKPRYITLQEHDNNVHPALARNRCVEDVYEPGSTFKPFMWSTTTALGLADPGETVDTEGGHWTTPYGRHISDVVRRTTMTWSEVLINSSNIGMAKTTRRMSDQQMRDAVLRFGFGRRTNIDLPGESPGIVTSMKNWSKYTQTSVAMGHEIAVTPVQMVRGFASFCRTGEFAGTMPELRLFAAAQGDSLAPATPAPGKRVVPQKIAELTRSTMRGVVANMDRKTAAASKDHALIHYELFGKSGTAEIPLGRAPKGKKRPRGSDGYFDGQYNSSFIAGGPVENPRLVVLVVIDDPGPVRIAAKTHYGSLVGGPVVRRVMERALAYMGVPASYPNGFDPSKQPVQQPIHE
jgi:cell division protein FtsI/penicillin-binding protein 2